MTSIASLGIAVLKGGPSSEREVSLVSGAAVAEALRGQVSRVVEIDVDRDLPQRLLEESPDVVFIALHGPFGEDGTVQGLLELLGLRYTGSGVLASALAMHKLYAKRLFQYHRIPTPDFAVLDWNEGDPELSLPTGFGGLPVVVKPCQGGSTIGISIVQEPQEFFEACRTAAVQGGPILVERFVEGQEITVGILDELPLPVVQIVPESGFYDYRAKYHAEGTTDYRVPAPIPPDEYRQVQDVALQAHRALGCRHFSRVDMRLDGEGRPHVLEVNTIPGLTPHSLLPKAAAFVGIDFDQLVASMIRLAVQNGPEGPAGGEA